MTRTCIKIFALACLSCLLSCKNQVNPPQGQNNGVSGDLIIFHAGSLSVPFQQIARAFEKENPACHVLLEASGSVDCARKITDLHKPCDLMASSDYMVIKKFLVPGYTGWYLPFAGNEIVLAYTGKSAYGDSISQQNWPGILLKEDVRYGRSDPDADPCGYRTLMVMQLAASYYGIKGLTEDLSSKDTKYIRPKEVDLLAMLELHETDFIFIYRSVAVQHNLKFLELPDQVNLKKMENSEIYRQASVNIKGTTPGTTMEIKGEPISYAITMLNEAPNPGAAREFLRFLLEKDKGMKYLEEGGHNSLIPVLYNDDFNLPGFLTKYAIYK
jgi:molybdate/tungstate transport system substrate-binding protein